MPRTTTGKKIARKYAHGGLYKGGDTKPRPSTLTRKEWSDRWDEIFGPKEKDDTENKDTAKE